MPWGHMAGWAPQMGLGKIHPRRPDVMGNCAYRRFPGGRETLFTDRRGLQQDPIPDFWKTIASWRAGISA